MSYDCVAETFSRDADNAFRNILNFIASLHEELDSIGERELHLAYRSFLHRLADAQLARLYAQADPSGSRIHRNIRDCLKNSSTLELRKEYRGNVIVPIDVDPLEGCEPFPALELERALLQTANSRQSIPQILESLHNILANQKKYRRSLLLIDASIIIKRLYQSAFAPKDEVEHLWSFDGLGEFELLRLRREVESALKEKIVLTYLTKGKIDNNQARALFGALQDIMEEWFAGEALSESLYSRFNEHLPIPPEVYEHEFRPRMEYLLKIARQELAVRLTREL